MVFSVDFEEVSMCRFPFRFLTVREENIPLWNLKMNDEKNADGFFSGI